MVSEAAGEVMALLTGEAAGIANDSEVVRAIEGGFRCVGEVKNEGARLYEGEKRWGWWVTSWTKVESYHIHIDIDIEMNLI